MALETLLIKQFPEICRNIYSVTATSDLNVLSIYNKEKELFISLIKTFGNYITLSSVEVFAWQEDNYSQNDYKLLVINNQNEICYYSIEVKHSSDQTPFLEKKQLSKWGIQNIFQSFQELAKSLGDVSSVTILRFEAKEAVFLFDGKVVVSFFPSCEEYPLIMSIADLRDNSPSHRKILLAKDILFALNEAGTKLSIYSFVTNSKLQEFGFSDYSSKHMESGTVKNFTVNLKLDLLIFITEDGQIYSMPLDLTSQSLSNSQANSAVTAFTKHFPSVKGLNENLRRFSTSSGSIQPLCFTCETEGLSLKDLFIVENKLCFVYHSDTQSIVGIHVLDSDKPTMCERLSQPAFLIKCGAEEVPFPLLLFSGNKIFLMLYNLEQDKLVNELMIYPSSGAVEILSSLNNWSNIHMDIEVLKLGLSNRQLYTVEFFLRTLFEGFCQLWKSAFTKQWIMKVKKECSLWDNILDLVLENVYKNLADSYTCQYAEQLLQVIIRMVIQIIAVIESKETKETCFTENDKDAFLATFNKFLLRMRKLLREPETGNVDVSDAEDNGSFDKSYNEKILGQWKKWEKLSKEEVIQDSIHSGNIPMAQSFFSCHRRDSSGSSYLEFEKAAENLVLDYLRQGLMEETILVLMNMGIDINSKLLDIFKSTSEKDIRALMLEELHGRDLLTERDMQSIQFISLLEKLYPCTSFEHARLLLDEKRMHTEDMVCAVPENDEKLVVGDFMDFNQDNSESGSYCRVVLNWLSSWNNDIKGRILAPHYLKNSPILEFFMKENGDSEIDKLSVWSYLLENGNLPYLMNWIDIWLGLHPQNSDSFSTLDNWPLSEEMINLIPEKATTYVAEALLNVLARNGIFCEEELENISSFLTRIGRSQCDINDISIFTSEKASLSFSDLCHRLVHYCLKHNLVQFLYTFLSNNHKKFSVWPSCHLCTVPLLNLTKSFYIWSQNRNDSQIAYDAIAGAAQYIFKLQNISSPELLCNVPLPLCLAILLFKPQPLSESVGELLKCSENTVQHVKEKFRSYPLLFNFLFKTPDERAQPDITIYELLKGSTKFDTSQLFGWQSSNSLKSEDSQSELPHFSLKSLSEQYGLKKELTYLYYLMEGRPNYSYLKFIAQEVVLETGLSISRVRSACRDVTDYALSNYRCSDISAACICFIELLGQDSLPLRACIVAANMLHETQIQEGEKGYDKNCPEIGRKFKQAYVNKDSASALLYQLEQIILNLWNPHNADSNALFQEIILWMPVMTLSHLFEVEAGNLYLNECAKQNNWLKFLVFSQMFQIPKEQVLKAASRFSNSCISYHIFHSLHRKSSLLYDVAYESKTIPVLKTPKKDIRKSLYKRIGLIKESPSKESKNHSSPEDDKISITSEETSSSSEVDLRSFVLKDLFSQLLLAHNSDSPWDCLLHTSYEIKNPVLALLAASYPDSRLENCFFTWLYTSLYHSEEVKKQVESCFSEIRVSNCSTDDLEKLIVLAIQNQKILTLWQGMHIFLPDTPLPCLMGFLRSFMVYKKFDSSIESFQNQLWDYPKHSDKSSVLYSLYWIENISVCMLKEAAIACLTSYERLIILRHFHNTKLEKSFSKDVKVPEYMKVYKMVQCLGEAVQDVNINNLFLPENNPTYTITCWEAVRKLLQCHLYDEAQMFSTAAKLPQDEMLILQINHETDEARGTPNWENLSFRVDFWGHILFKLKVLPLHCAVDFLEVQCEISDKFGEKYFLMKSVIDILKENKKSGKAAASTYNMEILNKKMWWWCIKAEVNKELLPEIFDVKSVHNFDMQNVFVDSHVTANSYCIDDKNEKEALGSIIGQFLCKKDVQKAFELATTFGFNSLDLKIIKTCLQLSRHEIDASSIDFSLPNCAPEVPSSRLMRSLLLWVVTGFHGISSTQKDTIQCMEKLSRKCTVAASICHQILVHYTIASALYVSYASVAKEKDAFIILKNLLVRRLKDEHVLAKSLIVVHELADKDVAKFLSEEIWCSLQILCSSDLVMIPEETSAFSDQVIYDPLRTNEGFQLIVKLCQDPSILGNYLMNIFSTESAELTHKSSDQSFSLLVDLCVCAHECFTAACNMDGISQILHSSQMLVDLLEEAEKFPIMVHLLTGLGRYSEMMYVFDILKSNDKLNILFPKKKENVDNTSASVLFEKNMEDVPSLRLALLDYLKRCPASEGDTYFYALANRFGMYREKAEILEMSVQKQLSQLCKKNTAIDNDLRKELDNALKMLSEAAESYCKADCLHQAQSCTRLAQLVALQIYFVPSGVWIIGLDELSVARFITDHDKFCQAYIVAEEYGNHHLWGQALLHNVVLRGDREYLREFQCNFGLPASLISDVVKRYQKLVNKNENIVRNMKLLLSLCSNVKVKYSLAQELGFSDMISELLMGEASSYLQDLMANNSLK